MPVKMVRDVFIIIGGVVMAMLLYNLFFSVGTYKGVLWTASNSVENAVSRYYYQNCYLPSVHRYSYLDAELGCGVYGYNGGSYSGIMSTPSKDGSITSLPSGSYSTGWY